MKKLVNIFAIVFFLTPIFASAATHHYVCSDFSSGAPCVSDTWTFSGAGSLIFDNGGTAFDMANLTTYYISFTYTGSGTGDMFCAGNGIDGAHVGFSGTAADQAFTCGMANVWNGLFLSDNNDFIGTISNLCVTNIPGDCVAPPPPPPPPPSSIDSAVAVATSSFALTYGFDMDGISIWMWDNLGQPILGSGIGTLYVMRWYWLGFIAISIIVLFAFAYFRFFKK